MGVGQKASFTGVLHSSFAVVVVCVRHQAGLSHATNPMAMPHLSLSLLTEVAVLHLMQARPAASFR